MGMVVHRGRDRDKLKMLLPKYFKTPGSFCLGQKKKYMKESCTPTTSEDLTFKTFIF